MKHSELLSKIVKTINAKELLDEKVCLRSYSGRFMYGRECASINTNDTFKLIATMYTALEHIEDISCIEAVQSLSEIISATCKDSMGLQSVIYWPDVEYHRDNFNDFMDDIATTIEQFLNEQQPDIKKMIHRVMFYNSSDDVVLYFSKGVPAEVEDLFGELAELIQDKHDLPLTIFKVDELECPRPNDKAIIQLWPAD